MALIKLKNQKIESDLIKYANRLYSEHIQEILTTFLGADWTPRDVIKVIPRPKILIDNVSLMRKDNKKIYLPENE